MGRDWHVGARGDAEVDPRDISQATGQIMALPSSEVLRAGKDPIQRAFLVCRSTSYRRTRCESIVEDLNTQTFPLANGGNPWSCTDGFPYVTSNVACNLERQDEFSTKVLVSTWSSY